MSADRPGWQGLLDQLEERSRAARSMGGDDRIARQKARGRLTARERLDAFLDADSFSEIGLLAGGCPPPGAEPVPADGLVAGTGRVQGRSVAVLAEGFTTRGGSIGHPNAAKRARLVRLAAEDAIPLVMMLDGAGERASNAQERYPAAPSDLQLLADLRGQVPIIALVLGTSAGHGALCSMFADLVVMLEGAALFTAGPPLVEAALGIEVTPEELGGSSIHTGSSGVAHNLAASEQEAFEQARYFLSLLPARAGDSLPVIPGAEPGPGELLDLLPADLHRAYDMRGVIDLLVDAGSFFEVQAGFGGSLLLGFARIGGLPGLVMANQPAQDAGAITPQAAEKATHFLRVASAFSLPLLSLVDNPGVMPGPDAERAGALRAAADMFAAQRAYRGRKVVVTLRKAFGFGSSVMGMNPWDRQAISIALPSVSLGGIPAIGGARAAGASEAQAQQLQATQSGAWVPADAMAFDKVVSPMDLRPEIVAAWLRDRPA